MFKNIFIGIVSVDKQNGLKAQARISNKLKIPKKLINIFTFPIEKDKTQKNKAISISHQEIVKQATKQNYTMTMIFEEDVDFYDNQPNDILIRKSINQVKTILKWDILFLGCFNPLYYSTVTENLEKVYYGLGTHGYLLSKIGMKKLLNVDFSNIRNVPIFDMSFGQIDFGVTGLMNGYQMKPMIAYQIKTPRLINFINTFYNHKGGFQKLLYRYIKLFWLLVLLIFSLVIYYLFKN